MIEVALVLSGLLRHWADVAVIGVLLVFNAAIGFWQQHTAADAVAALKRQLAPRAMVRRDRAWTGIDAAGLVPGDLVRVRLGDIVPADVVLLDGDYLRVDQSALTGESLPVDLLAGQPAYSGAVVAQGSMTAVVAETGPRTHFGRTTHLVATARPVSHFQQAVLRIGSYLIWLSLALVAVLVAVELVRGASALTLLQFALILTVAAIPVAMPAVLSVTMAVGALALSRRKAIVTRLESIEEMAGIDVLCSDRNRRHDRGRGQRRPRPQAGRHRCRGRRLHRRRPRRRRPGPDRPRPVGDRGRRPAGPHHLRTDELHAIYRITETVRIVLFVVAAMIAYDFYPITAILIILLTLFNDVPIMTIAVDNTLVDPRPVRWDMRRVLSVSTVLGVIGVVETFLMLVLARDWMHLDTAHIQTLTCSATPPPGWPASARWCYPAWTAPPTTSACSRPTSPPVTTREAPRPPSAGEDRRPGPAPRPTI